MEFLSIALLTCYKGQKMEKVLTGLNITGFHEPPWEKNYWHSLCTSHLKSHMSLLHPLLAFSPLYLMQINESPEFRSVNMGKETRQRFSKNVSFRDCSCNSIHPTPANHLVSPGTWCRPCRERDL